MPETAEPTSLSRTLRNAIRFKIRTQKFAARIFDLVLAGVVRPYHQNVFWGDRLLTLDKTAGFLGEPGFAAALMVKDLTLAQDAAKASGAATPLGKQAQEMFKAFDAAGNGGMDFSGIINHVRGLAGK